MKKHVISIANSGKVAPVNLETLKLYCDVVRLRSFSRGAASNAVSQSAASQAIQQLEAELDAALLDRSRRGIPQGVMGALIAVAVLVGLVLIGVVAEMAHRAQLGGP